MNTKPNRWHLTNPGRQRVCRQLFGVLLLVASVVPGLLKAADSMDDCIYTGVDESLHIRYSMRRASASFSWTETGGLSDSGSYWFISTPNFTLDDTNGSPHDMVQLAENVQYSCGYYTGNYALGSEPLPYA